jgi:hypothetical protein
LVLAGSPPDTGPRVRIRFPPAGSQKRTVRHLGISVIDSAPAVSLVRPDLLTPQNKSDLINEEFGAGPFAAPSSGEVQKMLDLNPGTGSSNPSPSSGESRANPTFGGASIFAGSCRAVACLRSPQPANCISRTPRTTTLHSGNLSPTTQSVGDGFMRGDWNLCPLKWHRRALASLRATSQRTRQRKPPAPRTRRVWAEKTYLDIVGAHRQVKRVCTDIQGAAFRSQTAYKLRSGRGRLEREFHDFLTTPTKL